MHKTQSKSPIINHTRTLNIELLVSVKLFPLARINIPILFYLSAVINEHGAAVFCLQFTDSAIGDIRAPRWRFLLNPHNTNSPVPKFLFLFLTIDLRVACYKIPGH